jgi:hypothetical protein
MREVIKKILPAPLKSILISIRASTKRQIDTYKKNKMFTEMQAKQPSLIKNIKKKNKIRVIFLAIHESVWKVDSVFKGMLADPIFEPEILVCPYVQYGEERMLEDMGNTYRYFKDKNYPVSKALLQNGKWVELKTLSPDLIFFTNPHNLTRPEYYEDAFKQYLSCYVPYYFMATKHAGTEFDQFNSTLFLSAWKLYWPHENCSEMHKKFSINKGQNGLVTGYPACEMLYSVAEGALGNDVWKRQNSNTKRIIYAPHHTIESSRNSLSSFLLFGDFFKSLAEYYQHNIQWSFKPHPILKAKLYLHADWGKEKTDAYYKFWAEQTFTQLDEGEYDDLFLTSDAIIHDCSSFIVEYAFTNKPCLYLVNDNNLDGLLNHFGIGVMDIYVKAKTKEEVKSFVDDVVMGRNVIDENRRTYFKRYLDKYYKKTLPSERIIADIKQSLGTRND